MEQSPLELGYCAPSDSGASSSSRIKGSFRNGWKRGLGEKDEHDPYYIESPDGEFTIAKYGLSGGTLYVLWEKRTRKMLSHQDGGYDTLLALWGSIAQPREPVEAKA